MPAIQATPWALDEFASVDAFVPTSAGVPDEPSTETLEAGFDQRLLQETMRIESEAYARGRADGERAARASLDATLGSAMQALDEALQSLQLHESRWLANAEENIAALAVIVARHIVQREVTLDPTWVLGLVQTALHQYPIDQEISIRLHPDDLAACRGAIASELGELRNLRWIADATIMRGGCLTEGRERIIDGRVDTALERAYRSIAGVQAS